MTTTGQTVWQRLSDTFLLVLLVGCQGTGGSPDDEITAADWERANLAFSPQHLEGDPWVGALEPVDPDVITYRGESLTSMLARLRHESPSERIDVLGRLMWTNFGFIDGGSSQLCLSDWPTHSERVRLAKLGLIGNRARFIVPAVAACLDDPSPLVRWEAVSVLVTLGAESYQALGRLRAMLRDPDARVRNRMLLAIAQIDDGVGADGLACARGLLIDPGVPREVTAGLLAAMESSRLAGEGSLADAVRLAGERKGLVAEATAALAAMERAGRK